MLRLDLNEELTTDEQGSVIPYSNLTSPTTIIEIPTKTYVDSLSENNRIRRDLSTVFNDQHDQLDQIKLTKLDSVIAIRNPGSDVASQILNTLTII